MEVLESNHFLEELQLKLQGEMYLDETTRRLYATDASSYRQIPLAVAYPRNVEDIKLLVNFAREHKLSLIPRTAGTSLAGQVVGGGIVVDVSRTFTKILEVNEQEKWVRVQPGVIRDELNMQLKPYGLLFGPETSTANRAMIGGMVGNNSCGSNSVVYGSTRDHLLEVKAVLADGSEAVFNSLSKEEFDVKCELPDDSLEGEIYREINTILGDSNNQQLITDNYPHPSIPRRNTGYALDLLMDAEVFNGSAKPFNFCKLIAGSEGTLAFITEIKVGLVDLPPKEIGLVCAHFDTIYDSLKATQLALKYNPSAVELMDHHILERTKTSISQRSNRFFLQGDPKALIVIELKREAKEQIEKEANQLIEELKRNNLGYHYPIVWGADAGKVWNLRKAGLGLLSNVPGDPKAVPVIEDTAVRVDDLPEYIQEFNEILKKYDLSCVHYAHAGSGELHLRPILDLKTEEGNRMFRVVLEEISSLVKKYKGSLSGEHGDGRLRGEFIPYMIGQENYELLKRVKRAWDPYNLFNPGKIVDTPSMNESLRFYPGQQTPEYDTLLDFSATEGIVRASEQCNGSGDCRKTELTGGTMCPSYMATRNEKHTTRARANIFREIAGRGGEANPFESEQIKDVLDLCLACKGCKAECPSNVDIAKIRAEFLYQYQKQKGISFRTWLVSNFNMLNKLALLAPWSYKLVANGLLSSLFKKVAGFAQKRSMPELNKQSFKKWFVKNQKLNFGVVQSEPKGAVWLLADEFTNYNDLEVGKAVVQLLTRLGYAVEMAPINDSGRALFSKGLLGKAKKLVDKNVAQLKGVVSESKPLIGIEPSALLSFRDEYLDLATDKEAAAQLAPNCFLFEEFLAGEIDKGNVTSEQFAPLNKTIKYHGHCHQKALSSLTPLKKVLSIIPGAQVELIPSGCCGMAGSFGYEKEHFDVSMQIGELVLFPTVRENQEAIIVAPGTSCRHQIKDGTGVGSQHPAEILLKQLLN
ncbi:MAG: FAD-binding protein [Cyclobacteriaceae bacterium]|nr:FAD-binding protein [Cyclobacteriaceae bacterium]